MDKPLSQEEIDALFNNTESNVEINEVNTSNDEKIDSLLDYKYKENANMIKKMFEENNKTDNINNDLINFQNSPFYPAYLSVVNNIDNIVAPVIHQLNSEYLFMSSINFDSKANLERLSKQILLPNMVIAQVVFDDLKQKVYDACNRMREEAGISEIIYETNIVKADYIQTGKYNNM